MDNIAETPATPDATTHATTHATSEHTASTSHDEDVELYMKLYDDIHNKCAELDAFASNLDSAPHDQARTQALHAYVIAQQKFNRMTLELFAAMNNVFSH